ncbi:MAG: permease, partial [Gemmatimonadota bacterium]|nr:permease [Gemmatimonadota bacterium]
PGLVAVPIAAFIVKELPLEILRWLVIVVILYTSAVMLRAAFSE